MAARLRYRAALRLALDEAGRSRATILDSQSFRPSIAGSLYEASMSRRARSPNTFENLMRGAQALISWSLETGYDLDQQLLRGEPLTRREIENYAVWLERQIQNENETLQVEQVNTFNVRLRASEAMVSWFVETCFHKRPLEIPRDALINGMLQTSKNSWRNVRKKIADDEIAPDLEDCEINAIESFLRKAMSFKNPELRWVRAYVIWRLAIEFGFRIGEILALRVQDCPMNDDPSIRIVRIDQRKGIQDPRGRLAPRPKTLSRELQPIIENTVFPHLLVEYQSEHRFIKPQHGIGRNRRRPILSHQYLLVTDPGAPLPISTAKSLAKSIAAEIGIKFSWHIARHAFFNRAYGLVDRIEDATVREIRMNDLLYWGGWRDPDSLAIYSRRVRRERSRSGLKAWQQHLEPWHVLG